MLSAAIIAISLALLLYTVGVWAERIGGRLRPWHLGALLLGLICDVTGTVLMSRLNTGSDAETNPSALSQLMSVSGTLAIFLMGALAVWGLWVLRRDTAPDRRAFHQLAVVAWMVWLVPYIAGAAGSIV